MSHFTIITINECYARIDKKEIWDLNSVTNQKVIEREFKND